MKILALDLGTKTGWAVVAPSGSIYSGVEEQKTTRFEGGGMRYMRFAQWLDQFHMRKTLDLVVFEEVRRHLSTDSAHAYGGFMATLTRWCEERKVPYQGVPVQTIKKFWTGKGNASKDVMVKIARERGFKPADDNEADALALLHWAMHEHKPKVKERRMATQ